MYWLRDLSHNFHGKGSGIKMQEKRLKKIAEEKKKVCIRLPALQFTLSASRKLCLLVILHFLPMQLFRLGRKNWVQPP